MTGFFISCFRAFPQYLQQKCSQMSRWRVLLLIHVPWLRFSLDTGGMVSGRARTPSFGMQEGLGSGEKLQSFHSPRAP